MSATALIVIDVQESFRQRPYFREDSVVAYVERQQALIDGASARGIPVIQIFHVEEEGVFSEASGFVTVLKPLRIHADKVFPRPGIARWSAPGSMYG